MYPNLHLLSVGDCGRANLDMQARATVKSLIDKPSNISEQSTCFNYVVYDYVGL